MDNQQAQKYLNKIAKVLQLEIEMKEPVYDEEGNDIRDEIEDQLPTPFHMQGIFNYEIVQEYYEDDKDQSSQASTEQQQVQYEAPEDREADFRKHVNVDQWSETDQVEIQQTSDQDNFSDFEELRGDRKNSLIGFDNLQQLQSLEEKQHQNIYEYKV